MKNNNSNQSLIYGLTPERFSEIEAVYKSALRTRACLIMEDVKTMTQQAAADKWGLNYSRISKIIKKVNERKGK